ncbi:MAG: membrane protein insertase YidC [Candidatus Babeliales bacterium]
MKIKELLVPLLLALLVTWGMQYYFGPSESVVNDQVKSGQRFVAPTKPEIQVHKPLNTEIDFLDAKATRKTIVTTIETNSARYEFSNDGASLIRVEFRRNWGGKEGYLTTLFPPAANEKENRTFLIAFDEKTPYYFDFINKKEEADYFVLSYKTSFDNGTLDKTFLIYKENYRIDLKLSFTVKEGTTIIPRIFFNSPLLPGLGSESATRTKDVVSGVINEGPKSIKIYPFNDETINSYWSNPTLFGSQDRYFVHTMVRDPHNFAQRGYFKAVEIENLFSILEGPKLTRDSTYELSFYVGPKEDDVMAAIDPRLEQTLNYGWFSFISKPLSKFLLDVLNIIYSYVQNYGWAIIILTILLKLLLLPFTYRVEDQKEMLKRSQEYTRKLEHIRAKYKDNPQALAQAQGELVKKQGFGGFTGCLPLLLQMPFFWALGIILSNAIELYRAPFLWVPDLSAPDPYYLLPILAGISILLHTFTISQDPKQRISSSVLAIFVAALFSSFSAGLVLFIMMGTLLGVLQSIVIRQIKA